MISNIIQIILALFIIIILYIIAYYTFNYESMSIVKVMGGSKAKKNRII
jgi:heme/copper-type cytochrome/quinol oxidase subunit 2